MIKVFKASKMNYTPFNNFEEGDFEYFQSNNIQIIDSYKSADIIVSDHIKHLKKFFHRSFLGVKFLLWTNEPRFDISFNDITRKAGLINIHHMNVYTKNVFINNLSFHAKMMTKKLNYLDYNFEFSSRKTVALMSYYKGVNAKPLFYNEENIDLIALRSKIALTGNELLDLDIFGKGWPNNIAIEDSRLGEWGKRKKEILKNYHFNLCFENTSYYNYMTEKIWNSIENYCLPIYYGRNTNAYEIFPKNSFIDYTDFHNPSELFQFIKSISKEEYILRINKCIEVYNDIHLKGEEYPVELRQQVIRAIIEKMCRILNT